MSHLKTFCLLSCFKIKGHFQRGKHRKPCPTSPPLPSCHLSDHQHYESCCLCSVPRPCAHSTGLSLRDTYLACVWSAMSFGFIWSSTHCLLAASFLLQRPWSRVFLRALTRSFVFSFADICWNGQHYQRCQITSTWSPFLVWADWPR